jgi:hypothetical protein
MREPVAEPLGEGGREGARHVAEPGFHPRRELLRGDGIDHQVIPGQRRHGRGDGDIMDSAAS